MSVIAAIMGVGMLVVFGSIFSDSTMPSGGGAGLFLILFVGGLLFTIGYHVFNAATGDCHAEVIENLSEQSDSEMDALNALIRQRERGEISIAEFDQRRTAIIDAVPKPQVPAGPENSERSVEERLKVLATLREKNLISDDEYASKRAEILGDL